MDSFAEKKLQLIRIYVSHFNYVVPFEATEISTIMNAAIAGNHMNGEDQIDVSFDLIEIGEIGISHLRKKLAKIRDFGCKNSHLPINHC